MPFSIKRIFKTDSEDNAEKGLLRDIQSMDKTEAKEYSEEIKPEVYAEEKILEEKGGFKEIFLEGLLFKNPAIIDFIGLTPIVVGGTTVKNGLVLSLVTILILVAVCVFASLTKNVVSKRFAPAVYTVFATVLLVPLLWLGYKFMPYTMFSLGIIFPLIAVNGLNLSRAEGFAMKNSIKLSLADALGKGLGFSAVLIIISCVREVLGYGTFYNMSVPFFSQFHSNVISGAPGGFIVMAVFAAIIQLIAQKGRNK